MTAVWIAFAMANFTDWENMDSRYFSVFDWAFFVPVTGVVNLFRIPAQTPTTFPACGCVS
jgi:hypothetical protein